MPFVKGQSGNPSGRPKGAAGLARYIGEQTNEGRELVDRLLDLSRSSKSVRESHGATLALLERYAGKAMQPSEINMSLQGNVDVSAFMSMPPARRLAWLDEQRAARALPAEPELETSTTPDSESDT